MDGGADPGGAWQFGRLEFRDSGFFVGLNPRSFTIGLGRRGAQVACRQLGFASGAEAIISTTSALPGPAGVTDIVSSIVCQGTEETLSDCGVFRENAGSFCFAGEDSCNAALVCSTPSGVPLLKATCLSRAWFATGLLVPSPQRFREVAYTSCRRGQSVLARAMPAVPVVTRG